LLPSKEQWCDAAKTLSGEGHEKKGRKWATRKPQTDSAAKNGCGNRNVKLRTSKGFRKAVRGEEKKGHRGE